MVATEFRAETNARVPLSKQVDKLAAPVAEQDLPAVNKSRSASASSTDPVQMLADVSAKTLQAISEEVQVLTRDIIVAEQEADVYLCKRAHCSVAENAWRSITREVPAEMAGKVQDMHDRLLAAQQGINDTALSEEAEAFRLNEVREELEASSREEEAAALECSGLRGELQEATRAIAAERALLERRPLAPTPLQSLAKAEAATATAPAGDLSAGGGAAADGVAAQKARSEALFELAAARSEATAASAELRGCEEALSEAQRRRDRRLEAASAGLAELECKAAAEASEGPVGSLLKAADVKYLESLKRSEELLHRVTTWRGLSASSRARAQAAEGKAQRGAQRQAAADKKAAEERERLEAAKPLLAQALEEKERAQKALEAARFWRQGASAALALTLSLATARLLTSVGLPAA